MKKNFQIFVCALLCYFNTVLANNDLYNVSTNLIEETNDNCTEVDPLTNLMAHSSENEIFLTWATDIEDNNNNKIQCERTKYDITAVPLSEENKQINSIIPYFRHEESTFHKISHLESCTEYLLSIKPTANDNYIKNITISTLPLEVLNLSVSFQNGKTIVEWLPPKNIECIAGYNVIFDNINNSSKNTSSLISIITTDSNLQHCNTISVRVITEDGRFGLSQNITTPGPVENLTVVVKNNSILLFKWEFPQNSSLINCVDNFLVKLSDASGNLYVNYTIPSNNESSIEFYNLSFCIEYTFEISAQNKNFLRGPSENITESLFPSEENEIIKEILIPTEIATDKEQNVTWNIFQSFVFCPFDYNVTITSSEYKLQDMITNVNYIVFNASNFSPCSAVNITVKPFHGLFSGKNITNTSRIIAQVRKAPIISVIDIGSHQVFFQWNKTDDLSTNCSIIQLNLTCISYKNNISHVESLNRTWDFSGSFNVSGFFPFINYTCWATFINDAGSSPKSNLLRFRTEEDVPSAPQNLTLESVNSTEFVVRWNHPRDKNGKLIKYKVEVIHNETLHNKPKYCPNEITKSCTFELNATFNKFEFGKAESHSLYHVFVSASTNAGYGPSAKLFNITTLEKESEPVRNLTYKIKLYKEEIYKVDINISFKAPCNSNSNIKNYFVTLWGTRNGYGNDSYNVTMPAREESVISYTTNLSAYNYILEISVITEYGAGIKAVEYFVTPDGVPPQPNVDLFKPEQIDATMAKFVFGKDYFSNINGNISYYAIILGELGDGSFQFNNYNFNFWNISKWPFVGYWSDENDIILPYQATLDYWNPFRSRKKYGGKLEKNNLHSESDCIENNCTFLLGFDDDCESNSSCNGPLSPMKEYFLVLRGFTRNGWRNSKPIIFRLDDWSSTDQLDIGILTGIILGAVAVVGLSIFTIRTWKMKQKQSPKIQIFVNNKQNEMDNIEILPSAVSITNFSEYYQDLKSNNQKLSQQYALINKKSSEEMVPHYAALLPINKKKNRYTNVLPFDENRVKLLNEIDPKDDFINASYIKGYSGQVEYIATQGPKENTCVDFWKMVLQEKVSVIAMVAQFVETNQTKCHKYFPNRHENLKIDERIEIRCITELNFGIYCLRTLLIRKELEQHSVTHLQFLNWPDHGCPEGTDMMIHFCNVLRQHIAKLPGLVIVHCSAGVGRTGTMIAVDILLQTIKDKKDIDIFGTVLNLRKQRQKMVQTEKQYFYIYDCINDVIHKPELLDWERAQNESEPIYENLEEVKLKTKESQL